MTTTKPTPRTGTSRDPSPSPQVSRAPRSGRPHPAPRPPAVASPPVAETPALPSGAPAVTTAGTLTVPISAALRRQLEAQAQEDGVSPTQLAAELLAEGLVRRAWDLPGRAESTASAPSQRTASSPPGVPGRGRRGRRPDSRGDRQRAPRPAAPSMDDQATFLAYVRQQERQRR